MNLTISEFSYVCGVGEFIINCVQLKVPATM